MLNKKKQKFSKKQTLKSALLIILTFWTSYIERIEYLLSWNSEASSSSEEKISLLSLVKFWDIQRHQVAAFCNHNHLERHYSIQLVIPFLSLCFCNQNWFIYAWFTTLLHQTWDFLLLIIFFIIWFCIS